MTAPATTLFADRYELRRRLGAGGAGEVYEAVARSTSGFSRRVALKLLVDPADGEAGLAAFREEARVVSRLHHGSIVGIVDFGVAGGAPFLVLELVDGLSAGAAVQRARARGAPMPAGVALAIAVDVARALHHAHEAKDDAGRPLGIVHRDVKPSNVLLSWEGDVKLGDFGIARAADRVRHTTGGFAKGTPGYMAPEQLAGAPVDARADVFALGCTLHALMVGKSPAATSEALVQLLAGAPLELDPSLDDDVRALVKRAIAPRPSERHPTALAFAEEAARVMARRLARDPRGELASFLAPLREGAPAAEPAPRASATVLSRVGATDAFETRATKGLAATRSLPARSRTFATAAALTLLLGGTFALGGGTVLWWSSRRAPPPVAPPPPLAAVEPVDAEAPPPPAPEVPNEPVAPPASASVPPPRVPRRPPAPAWQGPIWTRTRARGESCLCVDYRYDGHDEQVTTICRAIVPPQCVCWSPRFETSMRQLLCWDPPLPSGWCSGGYRPGKDGEPCEGYVPRGDAGKVKGTMGCSRCDSDYGEGMQTDPCTGFDEATGEPRKGILQCTVY